MNLEASLNYVTLHSQSIIQWLIVAICGLVAVLIARAVLGRGDAGVVGPAVAAPELKATLDQLLQQTAGGVTAAPAAAAGPAVDAAVSAKVTQLETDLRAREDEIAALKSARPTNPDAPAAAAAADPAADQRLKELEARLAEYAILEDDIADLSLYKEENTRLRGELETLKAKPGAAPAAAPAPAESAPAPTPAPDVPNVASARTAEAAAEAAASLAAFDPPAATPEPAPEAASASAAPAADEPIRHDLSQGADDLFAEFATALEESGVNLSGTDQLKTG